MDYHVYDPFGAGARDSLPGSHSQLSAATRSVDQMTYADWVFRLSAVSQSIVARELAGLSAARLQALADQYVENPKRKRTDVLRHAGLASVFCFALLLPCVVAVAFTKVSGLALSLLNLAAIMLASAAVVLYGLGWMARLHFVILERAHVQLGVLVSRLDEQHPWLYQAHLLRRHHAAARYCDEVLCMPRPLRGVDFVLMQVVARAYDELELTRTARDIVQQMQCVSRTDSKGHCEPLLKPHIPAAPEGSGQ